MPIQGTIGDLNYYKAADGSFRVRRKTSVNKERMANDPAFARTREHMAEFVTVAKAGKILRDALNKLTSRVSDKTMGKRLASALFSIAKADRLNKRGRRNLMDGDITQLKGFEFSSTGSVATTYIGGYTPSIDRASGKLSIAFPAFVPEEAVYAPAEATHFQLHAAGLEINFDTGAVVYNLSSTPRIERSITPVTPGTLEASVTPNSTNPLLLFFAIEFWMESNGDFYQLNNKVYNGVVVADVSKA